VVVVHDRGCFTTVGSGDAPDVLDEPILERDWGREEQGVEGRAVESFADEGAGADNEQGMGALDVVGELFGDFSALACFHLAAEHDDGFAGRAEPLGYRVEVIDPRGKHEDVRAASVSGEDIGDDLVEPGFVGDQGSVDLGHSAWGAGIGVPGVSELGGVQMEDRVRYEQIGVP